MRRGDERPHVRLRRAIRRTDTNRLRRRHERRQHPFRRRAHRERCGARHAAFARAAESSLRQAFHGLRDIRVRHHHNVIFRSAIRLHAFPVPRPRLVNIPRDRRRSDERNRAHFRMREQRIHALAPAMHEIQHALWQPRFFQKLHERHRRQRHLLAWLQHERISTHQREREHPERHHRGEIERRDPGAHAERLEHRLAVHPAREIFQRAAHQQRRRTARILDILQPAKKTPARLHQRLPMLARNDRAQPVKVFLHELPVAKHHPRPLHHRRIAPSRKRRRRRLDCRVHLRRPARRTLRDHLARRRIKNRRPARNRTPFAADVVRT